MEYVNFLANSMFYAFLFQVMLVVVAIGLLMMGRLTTVGMMFYIGGLVITLGVDFVALSQMLMVFRWR